MVGGYLAAEHDDEEGWWVINSVWLGDGLDDDTHLALMLGALESATTDQDLWRIGDQPVEEGLAPRPGAIERLRSLRRENVAVDLMWRVMQAYHADVRDDRSTWWRVDSRQSGSGVTSSGPLPLTSGLDRSR